MYRSEVHPVAAEVSDAARANHELLVGFVLVHESALHPAAAAASSIGWFDARWSWRRSDHYRRWLEDNDRSWWIVNWHVDWNLVDEWRLNLNLSVGHHLMSRLVGHECRLKLRSLLIELSKEGLIWIRFWFC